MAIRCALITLHDGPRTGWVGADATKVSGQVAAARGAGRDEDQNHHKFYLKLNDLEVVTTSAGGGREVDKGSAWNDIFMTRGKWGCFVILMANKRDEEHFPGPIRA